MPKSMLLLVFDKALTLLGVEIEIKTLLLPLVEVKVSLPIWISQQIRDKKDEYIVDKLGQTA